MSKIFEELDKQEKIIVSNTRSIPELCQLLINQIDKLHDGLCGLATTLLKEEIINRNEFFYIMWVIKKNKPESPSIAYYFPCGDKISRIGYLSELINKHQ